MNVTNYTGEIMLYKDNRLKQLFLWNFVWTSWLYNTRPIYHSCFMNSSSSYKYLQNTSQGSGLAIARALNTTLRCMMWHDKHLLFNTCVIIVAALNGYMAGILSFMLRINTSLSKTHFLYSTSSALQNGKCCGRAILEACSQDLQELCGAQPEGLLQHNKVPPHH